MSQALDKPHGDRISSICDDGDFRGRRFEGQCQWAAKRGYHVRVRAHYFAGQFHMAVSSPLSGVAFYHEVLPLNEAEPLQLLEQSAVKPNLVSPHVADLGHGG